MIRVGGIALAASSAFRPFPKKGRLLRRGADLSPVCRGLLLCLLGLCSCHIDRDSVLDDRPNSVPIATFNDLSLTPADGAPVEVAGSSTNESSFPGLETFPVHNVRACQAYKEITVLVGFQAYRALLIAIPYYKRLPFACCQQGLLESVVCDLLAHTCSLESESFIVPELPSPNILQPMSCGAIHVRFWRDTEIGSRVTGEPSHGPIRSRVGGFCGARIG